MLLQNAQAEFVEALLGNDFTSGPVIPLQHLALHRNNMLASLSDALQSTYPLVFALLGESFFNMATREYIRQYPSRSGNLNEYGEYFSTFLAGYKPIRDLIYLAEVAEFEWICHTLYTAPNHPPYAAHALTHFAPEQYEQLHFILNPAARLQQFHFPILDIVDLCKANSQQNINMNKGGVDLLLIRRDLDISLIALERDDYLFLEALSADLTLNDALHAAFSSNENYPLAEKLPEFIQNKILVDAYI